MSLYYEAARVLAPDGHSGGATLKARVYGGLLSGGVSGGVSGAAGVTNSSSNRSENNSRVSAAQVYGLCCEATRWSAVLSGVIERSGLLAAERKITPTLALLLVYDLLIGKGVAARKDHALSLAVHRHKARLGAELTRERIRQGQPSLEAWRQVLVQNSDAAATAKGHPRWVRVNTLVTSVEAECSKPDGVFHEWQAVQSLAELFVTGANRKVYFHDPHVRNLLATPPGTESYLTRSNAYRKGHVILQDKASCFPAALLFSTNHDGDIIDACAAPGNKTTHLAALASEAAPSGRIPRVTAVERDKNRARTLVKMVATAGADRDRLVNCLQGQDFARLDVKDARWRHVTRLLLDPSCSGSGIVGRDQGDDDEDESANTLVLPSADPVSARSEPAKKKRKKGASRTLEEKKSEEKEDLEDLEDQKKQREQALKKRLTALQGFQLTLLLHAFQFPAARVVVYSTCSVHAEENEQVVVLALSDSKARSRGWRIMRRAEQIQGLRKWHVRGDEQAVQDIMVDRSLSDSTADIADACIRCNKGTDDGTMGFFAVGFVRDGDDHQDGHGIEVENGPKTPGYLQIIAPDSDEEFSGFSD